MVWSFVISRFPHQGWLVSLSLRGASLMGKRYSTVFGRNPSEMVSECCLSYKQGHVGIYNFWRFSVNWTLNNCDVCCKLLSLRVISHIFRVYLFYKWSLEWSPCPRRSEWEPPGFSLGKTLLTPSRGLAETGVEHPLPYHGLSGGTPVHITQRSRGNDKIVVWL